MKRIPGVFIFILLCNAFSQAQVQDILGNPDKISVTKVDNLNSGYQETNLSVSPDGSYMFFRSDRGGMPWSRYDRTYKSSCRADGDIYFSANIDHEWSKAVCLPKSINNGEAQDEPCILPDGKTIIYQDWSNGWQHKGGPYYAASLNGMSWTDPKGLGGGINEFFIKQMDKYKKIATDGMSVSPDGNTLIFASGRDYNGSLDLYISKKNNNAWSYPEKLNISTDKDERSVFFTADGRTLFFASDGYNGLGGLDIYKAEINKDGSFGPVINIGAPFNSPRDDYGFILTSKGDEAYFVRDGDIYHAGFAEPELALPPLPIDSAIVSPADHKGYYEYKGFRDYSVTVNYEFNDYKIGDNYFNMLKSVLDTLKSNPSFKLAIYGHTDSIASEEYNLELGAMRANTLKDYFTAHGISADRIQTLSFGEYNPLYPQKSSSADVNAARNRRSEIWIKN